MAVVVRPKTREVVSETPAGVIDGANVTFSTAFSFVAGQTRVFLNGQRLKIGVSFDYVELTTSSVLLAVAPKTDDHLVIDYLKG